MAEAVQRSAQQSVREMLRAALGADGAATGSMPSDVPTAWGVKPDPRLLLPQLHVRQGHARTEACALAHVRAHPPLHSSIRLHLQERIGVLESTLRAEREERHAERLAEARRAEALQRRVDTLAGEAEAANKDPVSTTAAGCRWVVPVGFRTVRCHS